MTYIGLSLDVGRKSFGVDAICDLIRRMAELGFTALHLHLTETHRVGVVLPGFEELAAPDAWTPADTARLVATAQAAGIALIPEIDLPSHAAALLVGREHLQLTDRRGRVHADRLDIARPEARRLALDLLEASAYLFPGEWIHLGGDEFLAAPWEDEDAQHPERFPSLVAHAREVVGPGGTALDSYALFMNELAARARELGRTPILWNDHVVPACENPLVPITTDAVLDVWIRWRDWTPSVTDYLESGYRVLNSNGDLLYVVLTEDGLPAADGVGRNGTLRETFRPRRFMGLAAQRTWLDVPPAPPGTVDPVLGASLSLWCDSPGAATERETLSLLETWMEPFAEVMRRPAGS
ncbi:family 20 glycosylhydrolase [Brachybacterium sp. J153]|uniref:family 20 glycosylhydrolase n=1 Tax=Brachybacterium sp. J153 TaxID=3116488 RepID=UPI002E787A00|nr:family 20 glycosylhydrolase [Brachybacterium sp. J153]MEE1618379.1 family 20 glycosylhydrolase [Brachybacterium sp. J153]